MVKPDGEKLLIRWHEMRHNEELSQVSDELKQYKIKCSRLEKQLEFFKAKEIRFFKNRKIAYSGFNEKSSTSGSSYKATPKNIVIFLIDEITKLKNILDELWIENNSLRKFLDANEKQFNECQEELIQARKRLGCHVYQSLMTRKVKNTFPAHNQLDTLRLKYQNLNEENKILKSRNQELREQQKILTAENLNLNKTIEKTRNLSIDYETLKNELKTIEEKLQSSIHSYNELSRQKIQQENVQQSSMDRMISKDKKRVNKIFELEKIVNDYKLQIDNLTNKINQLQYEHEINKRDKAKELEDAHIHIRKLIYEKLKVPKNDNKVLKKEYELIKMQLNNKQTYVLALRSQIEQLILEKRSLQDDACCLHLVMTSYNTRQRLSLINKSQ